MAIHLTSAGIDFSAISSGDLLDDFEEGTWTPTADIQAFNNKTYAAYMKVGPGLFTTHHSRWDSAGSSNSGICGAGIPFANEANEYCSHVLDTNAPAICDLPNLHVRHNTSGVSWCGYHGHDQAIPHNQWNVNNGHWMWTGWSFTAST